MTACKVCNDPLLLEIDDDDGSGERQHVPDDLELSCGDHFHWQCLLDQSSEVAISLKCPGATILTRYTNEGGVQDNLDILPAVTEEAYLEANPEARPARAYHVMCSEGDVAGIVELLRDVEQRDGDDPAMDPASLIRYQDPLANLKSGLHLAVEKDQEEVVFLLLWIASTTHSGMFPEAAVAAAQSLGIQRSSTAAVDDIRLLQDDRGRTAEAVAAEMNGMWNEMLHAGLLHSET